MRINRHALREIRERSGLSVPALAKEAGCRHGTLYDIEHGNKGASPEMALKLAKALKVPLVAILADPSDPSEVA